MCSAHMSSLIIWIVLAEHDELFASVIIRIVLKEET